MKAQLSLMTKPIILILTISVMLILIYTIYSGTGSARLKEREIDLRTVATNTILVLANSEQCLAYRVPVILGDYANVVAIEKLELFSEKYKEIEPECARNYDFGWRSRVIEIDREGNAVKEWNFGSKDFSKGSALRQGVITNMPIAIRYSKYDIRPGRLEIKLIDGELEQLTGFLDRVCSIASAQTTGRDITLSYPAYSENSDICLGFGSEKACRRLLCPADIDLNPGEYYLSAFYKDGTVMVII